MISFGPPAIEDNGTVYRRAGKNRKVLWVECPNCGPQPPEIRYNDAREEWATFTLEPHDIWDKVPSPLVCSLCGRSAPYRESLTPQTPSNHEKCNRRCLNGKLVCRCPCQGRCHGEGTCYCKEEANV